METRKQKPADSDDQRGRRARRPSEIPRKGWWDILLRVIDQQSKDNLSIVSAGVAFYWFLAVFPALSHCGFHIRFGSGSTAVAAAN